MLLLRLPGVYAPQSDTDLLAESLMAAGVPRGARVLDIGTGTGRLALALKRAGAGDVVAVDVSRRAILSAWCNARVHRLPVRAQCGDALRSSRGPFDLIVANPPYVPASGSSPPRGRARAWDAGPDGRALLDRICQGAPAMLSDAGELWLVHSALSGPHRTLEQLEAAGTEAEIVRTAQIPFGPVLRSRLPWLRSQGLLGSEEVDEQLVVVRARKKIGAAAQFDPSQTSDLPCAARDLIVAKDDCEMLLREAG